MDLHPLHALYLGRTHGEAGTFALQGAGMLAAGLGLAAAVVVADLAAKLTGGK